jgi:phosphohistidine swiveling domain-containing protein
VVTNRQVGSRRMTDMMRAQMDHPLARPKWVLPEGGTAARLTREAVLGRVQENLRRAGATSWSDLGGERWEETFSARDGAELAREIFAAFRREEGRKYFAGCEVALHEAPERYILRSGLQLAVPASEFADGVIGDGDNVFSAEDLTGTVFVVREVSEVDRLMTEGVPEGTIGVIDDAGGTLTAPILPDFDAVICLAGSVRSHLAIIAREFSVPTLMGARLTRPLRTGERITVAFSAPAQNVEAYFGEDLAPRAEIRPAGV